MLELGYSRGFLEKRASVRGLRGDDLGYRALSDDRITRFSEPRIAQKFLNVAQANVRTVDEILAFARTVISSCYRDFVIFDIERPVRVVENERDLGKSERFTHRGSVEDHVFHFLSAEGL